MVKICLNMIVKNESKIITRLFDSVVPIIDYWIISDTGSTDGTPECIQQYFADKNIPGEVVYHPWKNFGHNRTASLKCAQQSSFEFDYILLLDADMKLCITPDFNKSNLTNKVYQLQQRDSFISYYNTRLIKKNVLATCLGPTHEYYSINEDHTPQTFDQLYINDIGDGGSKQNKYSRDIQLLCDGIAEEPTNARYYFYLARSYECVGEFDKAIANYTERIRLGGWMEEVWYSYYCIGNMYLGINDEKNALYNYTMAMGVGLHRVENFYKLAEHYRKVGKHELSMLYVKNGMDIMQSTKDSCELLVLFKESPIYNYLFNYEISILMFYLHDFKRGRSVSNKMLLKENCFKIPSNIINSVWSNYKFYVEKLPISHNFIFDFTYVLNNTSVNSAEYLFLTNPALCYCPDIDKFLINLRCINFYTDIINDRLTYKVKDMNNINLTLIEPSDSHPVKTENIFCTWNKKTDASTLVHKMVIKPPADFVTNFSAVQGIEDIRMIYHKNVVYLIGNSRELCPDTHPRIVLITFPIGNDGSYINNKQNFVVLNGFNDDICQKNWSPFINKNTNTLQIIYSFSPLIVLQPDIITGKCEVLHTIHNNLPHSLKGGSNGVYINNFLYFVIHEVVYEAGRQYYHRLVKLNDSFNIIAVSKPFIFERVGIEYCCGLSYCHSEKLVYISWGSFDKSANVLTITKDDFLKQLDNIDSNCDIIDSK